MPLGKFLVCLLKMGRGFGVPHLITRNQLCCIQRGRNVLGAELLFRTYFVLSGGVPFHVVAIVRVFMQLGNPRVGRKLASHLNN